MNTPTVCFRDIRYDNDSANSIGCLYNGTIELLITQPFLKKMSLPTVVIVLIEK